MSRLFLYIFPTDIITVSVNVFFVSRYKDCQLALMKTEDGETLQALLRIKMNYSDAMFEECVPAVAKAWLSECRHRLGFGVPV